MKKVVEKDGRIRCGALLRLFAVVLALCAMVTPLTAAAAETTAAADPSTMAAWEDYAGTNTEYVGRVWTDKSVSTGNVSLTNSEGTGITVNKTEGADFLVSFSALSSAMKNTAQVSIPLDIVLVLDVSGSMVDDMDTYTYTAEYEIETNGWTTYYALVEDNYGTYYAEIERITSGEWWSPSFDHWELDGQRVTPKRSAGDTSGIQFYTRSVASTNPKIQELQSAVGDFLDAVSAANEQAATDKQHRVALVKFAGDSTNNIGDHMYEDGRYDYNYSQIVSDFSTNMTTLKTTVNRFEAAGATAADYGLNHAQRLLSGEGSLTGARQEARKLVIFFTDGEPNHQSGFNATVANDAIEYAKAMKDAGTTIYSIGIFEGANSRDTTTNTNAYMHGVSSNYPNATRYTNLGTRVENGDYYKTTSNSGSLSDIFTDIFDTEGANATSPIVSTAEGTAVGYIEFTDQLGDYMEVKDFNAIVYGDTAYTQKTSDSNNGVTTYVFKQVIAGNEVYGPANLEDVIIQVTKSSDPKVGDQVTVKIPATAIPMRYYKVDTDLNGNTTMTVTPAYPIRTFFSVGTKDGTFDGVSKSYADALADGSFTSDTAFAKYVSDNVDTSGKLSFYSNAWGQSSAATAQFNPAKTNNFYYFTADTPIYTDKACTTPLTSNDPIGADTYYYYKNVYYRQSGTTGEIVENDPVEFKGSLLKDGNMAVDAKGNRYVVAGTQKTKRHDDFLAEKTENTTGTYDNSYEPAYMNDTTMEVKLGNNGKLSVDVAGSLAISKTVEPAEGFTIPEGKDFNFQVKLSNAAGKTYTVAVTDAAGQPVEGSITNITFNPDTTVPEDGVTTFPLQHGQTLTITGLPAGATYTVTEVKPLPGGFTQTGPMDDQGQVITEVTGSIAANENKTAAFTNTYSADPVTYGDEDTEILLEGTKTMSVNSGSFTLGDGQFSFTLTPVADDDGILPPLPAAVDGSVWHVAQTDNTVAKVVNTGTQGSNASFDFGAITFIKPGTYTYKITEDQDPRWEEVSGSIPGVTYDNTVYTLEIVVADNGAGQLVIQSSTLKVGDAEKTTAAFTNTFAVDSIDGSTRITKKITGRNFQNGDTFAFDIVAAGTRNDSPIPAGELPKPAAADSAQLTDIQIAADGNSYSYTATINPASGTSYSFDAGTFTYTAPGTYTFTVKEQKGGTIENGLTYDGSTYVVTVTVTQNANAELQRSTSIQRNGESASAISFTNSYNASTTLDGETNLKVTKAFTGRPWRDSDIFDFTLSAPDGTPMPAGYVAEEGKRVSTITITNADPGYSEAFGDIAFTQADAGKTYTYTIRETRGTLTNVTYDGSTKTITVKVNDDGAGNLSLVITGDTNPTFENSYQDTVTLQGNTSLKVSKTLSGRDWADGDSFTFQLTRAEGSEEAPMPASGTITIDYSDPSNIGSFGNITYDQDDLGKTYTYTIKEVLPADDDTATDGTQNKGVTYDQSVYQVRVAITDTNNDGELEVTSTMTKDGVHIANNTAAFTNTYTASSTTLNGTENLAVSKTITGRGWRDGEQFEFTLTGDSGAPMPVVNTLILTKNKQSGAFGDITYQLSDLKGETSKTFHYTIWETAGTAIGMTYDTSVYNVAVTVTDNGDGTLHIEDVAYTKASGSSSSSSYEYDADGGMLFTNTYRATAKELMLNGRKKLTGRTLEPEQFKFKISRVAVGDTFYTDTDAALAAGVPLPVKDGRTVGIGQEIGNGSTLEHVSFGQLTFTGDHYNKIYTYTIVEVNEGKAGYTYDTEAKTVSFTVTEDQTGGVPTVSVQVAKDPSAGDVEGSYFQFNNTYTAGGTLDGETYLGVEKAIEGRDWLAGETYTFQLLEGDEVLDIVTLDSENPVRNFQDITYTVDDVGTHTYTIREVLPVVDDDPDTEGIQKNGITYDQTVYPVQVNVTDNGDGTLNIQVIDNSTNDHLFTNRYQTTGRLDGAANLKVQKILEGRDWIQDNPATDADEEDIFSFTLEAGNELTKQAIAEGKVALPENSTNLIISASDEEAGYAKAFGDILFRGSGDAQYTFTIQERAPQDDNESLEGIQSKGVTYDDRKRTVVVNVIDNNNGTLTASLHSVTTEGVEGEVDPGLTFTNTYDAAEAQLDTAGFTLDKKFTGRTNDEWKDSDVFTFTLEPVDNAPMPMDEAGNPITTATVNGTMDEDKDNIVAFDFGTITYDQPGTYQYTVTETVPDVPEDKIPGVTYATNIVKITVSVSDNLNGQLVAAVTAQTGESTDASFVNTYATGKVDYDQAVGLRIEKNLTDRGQTAGQFAFTITGISENATELLGEDNTMIITNTDADLVGHVSTSTMAITTGKIFSQADAGKEYTFTVEETQGGGAGYTNDRAVYEVSIEVTENAEAGTITVTTTVNDEVVSSVTSGSTGEPKHVTFPFNNRYDGSVTIGDGEVQILANKTLHNKGLTEDMFTFVITDSKGNEIVRAQNDAHGAITFDPIIYTMATLNAAVSNGSATRTENEDGSYTYTLPYTVAEDTDNLSAQGITANQSTFAIMVNITDNGSGELTASVVYPDGSESLAFVNTYGTTESATVNISGNKVLKGAEGKDLDLPELEAGMFTFTITGSEGAPLPDKTTVTNDASGNVNFGEIEFTIENVFGNDSVETQSEDDVQERKEQPGNTDEAGLNDDGETENGATENGTTENGTTENEDSKVEGEPGQEVAGLSSNGTVKLTLLSDVTQGEQPGDGQPEDGQFQDEQFQDEQPEDGQPEDGQPEGEQPEGEQPEGGQSQDGQPEDGQPEGEQPEGEQPEGEQPEDGQPRMTVFFDGEELPYHRSKEITYTITESGNVPGVTNDPNPKEIRVTVYDMGDGTVLVLDSSGNQVSTASFTFTFTNVYDVEEVKSTPTEGHITLTKDFTSNVTGDYLEDGQFQFQMKEIDGQAQVVSTGTNDLRGNVEMSSITFSQKGTYTYILSEVIPEGAALQGDGTYLYQGTKYSGDQYIVTATVTDDSKGNLSVEWSMEKRSNEGESEAVTEAVFSNSYNAAPVTVTLGATKVMDGRALKGDDFEFVLAQLADGVETEVQTVKNDADGRVAFEMLEFRNIGEYKYVIYEKAGTESNMAYDKTKYEVTITVTDDGMGNLKATADNDGNPETPFEPKFNNTYKASGTLDDLTVTKVLKGRDWKEGETFTFQIQATGDNADNAPMPSPTTLELTADKQTGAFGGIAFDQNHIGHTFTYRVTEIPGSEVMNYSQASYTVTVTVKDGGNGSLTLDKQIVQTTGDGDLSMLSQSVNTMTFTNTYAAVTVTPADITIYVGGNDGYDAVVGDQETVTDTTSLPTPLFYVQCENVENFDPLALTFTSDEKIPGTDQNKQWRVEHAGKDQNGTDLYYLVPAHNEQDNVRITISDGENVYTNDTFDPSVVKDLYEDFDIDLYTATNNPAKITVTNGNNVVYAFEKGESGTLRVRIVENTAERNPVYSVTDSAPSSKLEAGSAQAVDGGDTSYTLNNTTVTVNSDNVHLLFDTIYDKDGVAREEKMLRETDEWDPINLGYDRYYQARYLDLVDANNGNAWVKANKAVNVIWAYPEGTDENTEFKLLQFNGLHRDDAEGQSGYSLSDIESAEKEEIAITNTEAGISFSVDPGDFSPYVLYWEVKGASGDISVGKDVQEPSRRVSVKKSEPFEMRLTIYTEDGNNVETRLNGIYGDVTFVNGVAEFGMYQGENVRITGLPAGLHYKLEEIIGTDPADPGYGYRPSYVNQTGVIGEGTTARIRVTNTWTMGDIIVSKVVNGPYGQKDKDFQFRITLSEKSINGEHGDVEFDNGVATFTLKHGESITIADIPEGVTYTVRETIRRGHTVSSTNEKGTIVAGEDHKVQFVNTKNTRSDLFDTGDTFRLGLWITVLAASAVGICAVAVIFFKKRKNNKKKDQ